MSEVADLLRSDGEYAAASLHLPVRKIIAITVGTSFVYGFVMGSHDGQLLQSIYSGCKVPMLMLVATVIALPSFYVVNLLLGLRDDFTEALRGVLVTQAAVSVCLLSLAPVVVTAYLSSDSYPFATFANGACFLIASVSGQFVLSEYYRPLIARNPKHRTARNVWLLIYIIVAIQWAWVLRPFIGWPEIEPTFFRERAWGNAYIQLVDALGKLLR